MEEGNQTVFVLDTFSKYENNKGVRRIFQIYGVWYCIREVKLNWGKVITPHIDDEFLHYELCNTLEEANAVADKMIAASKIPF